MVIRGEIFPSFLRNSSPIAVDGKSSGAALSRWHCPITSQKFLARILVSSGSIWLTSLKLIFTNSRDARRANTRISLIMACNNSGSHGFAGLLESGLVRNDALPSYAFSTYLPFCQDQTQHS